MPLTARSAAVLGRPIRHSLSPVLHRAAYSALGLTGWTYSAIDCDEDGLAGLLGAPGVAGYSCTMPLKRAVLRLAEDASPQALAIGAGNTLVPREHGWYADNTDWIGIRDALAAQDVLLSGTVTLLGAGGTAQAALATVAGVAGTDRTVTVLVRDPARTGELRATAERLGVEVSVGRLGEPIATGLVISTLPAGAADDLELPDGTGLAVLDAVYAGWPTALARTTLARGGTVVSGAAMLLYQAARQVELMTGRAAPVEAMRAALLAAVPGCGA